MVFALGAFWACSNDNASVDFTLEEQTLRMMAVGGTEKVKLNVSERWIASTDNPWITVSPANGVGTTP